jgi:hypothetical protein
MLKPLYRTLVCQLILDEQRPNASHSQLKGIPMHQIMPYLNAVCNSYKDSKFCWYMIQMHQETREIDVKLVNTLKFKMYLLWRILGCRLRVG